MRNWKQATDWASVEFDFDRIVAARGNDRIYGTAGDDDLRGTRRDDRFDLSQGGDDVAHGGAGNDRFRFDETFDENDRVFGGAGNDKVILLGDYRDGVFIDPEKFVGVEKLILESGATVRIGDGFEKLQVYSDGGSSVDVDGSAMTSGRLVVRGSFDSDIISGGHSDDKIFGDISTDLLTGGGGADKFIYKSANDSRNETLRQADVISDFSGNDIISLPELLNAEYRISLSGQNVGDIVLNYDPASEKTSVDIFLDTDSAADMTIYLVGNHLDLVLVNVHQLIIGS